MMPRRITVNNQFSQRIAIWRRRRTFCALLSRITLRALASLPGPRSVGRAITAQGTLLSNPLRASELYGV
jgi:hypothetical protein